jgi:hypothetical protein
MVLPLLIAASWLLGVRRRASDPRSCHCQMFQRVTDCAMPKPAFSEASKLPKGAVCNHPQSQHGL